MSQLIRNQQVIAENLLGNFPILAITGARQCGKTSLAKTLRPEWRYLDLENPNDKTLISNDPVLYFKQYPSDIIIDEAQTYPELFNVLRGVVDNDRDKKNRFILTGSSSPELTTHISESLAGRIATIELGTLKINEFYHQPLSPFYEVFTETLNPTTLINGKAPFTIKETQDV